MAKLGHRMQPLRYLVQSHCECGWESGKWCGKGARGQALIEWRWHVETCSDRAKLESGN